MTNRYVKRFSPSLIIRETKQNHNEISLHTHKMALFLKKDKDKITSVENVEKLSSGTLCYQVVGQNSVFINIYGLTIVYRFLTVYAYL